MHVHAGRGVCLDQVVLMGADYYEDERPCSGGQVRCGVPAPPPPSATNACSLRPCSWTLGTRVNEWVHGCIDQCHVFATEGVCAAQAHAQACS